MGSWSMRTSIGASSI